MKKSLRSPATAARAHHSGAPALTHCVPTLPPLPGCLNKLVGKTDPRCARRNHGVVARRGQGPNVRNRIGRNPGGEARVGSVHDFVVGFAPADWFQVSALIRFPALTNAQ